VRLAHLSDPHLPPGEGGVLPARVFNKRLLSLLSWHVKRHRHHRAETLDRLVADMRAHTPDLITVTGDLTNLGLAREYRTARGWLEALGTQARVTVIPGNHDALVDGAWEEGAAEWRPFWEGDETAEGQDAARAFPILRRRGPLALVGVSSAVATAPGLAVGEVGEDQMRRLGALLRRTHDAGLCRVLLIHHPPLDGTVRHRKRLRDAAALRAVLENEGVELVLHGHSHRSHQQLLQTSAGLAPVIGAPSASSMHREPASYHLFDITPSIRGWDVGLTTRHLAAGQRMETSRCASLAVERAHAR
jgi:3',5'-cyclic AMP phosphodiesterase CpdA